MLKYSDRDYYEQNVNEIIRCIEQSVGKDINWALKIVQSMQGEKGKGREMLYAAQKHLDLDDAREQRLIEVVTDLFDHAVQKKAPLLVSVKAAPEPEPPAVNTVLLAQVMSLLTVPKKHADSHVSIRAKNAIESYTEIGPYENDWTIERVVNSQVSQLVQLHNVGYKAAKFIFARLEPLRNKPVEPPDGSRDFCGIKYYPHTFLVECPDSEELNAQVEEIIELIKIKGPTLTKYDYLRSQQAATAVRNALTSNWNTSTGKYDPPKFTIEQVINMTPEDLLSIKFVGTKLAILVFKRLGSLRNKPVDALGVDKV